MNRRMFLGASSAMLFSGCAGTAPTYFAAEEFAVGAWNASDRELEQIRVIDVARPEMWWFSQSGQRPRPRRPNLSPRTAPSFGGDYRSGIIPDAVTIQWRELPAAGGKPYTGQLKGPFLVANIRSRIPADVLRMARVENHILNLTFTSGVEPVRFDWMLERYPGTGRGEIVEIARGGDSIK